MTPNSTLSRGAPNESVYVTLCRSLLTATLLKLAPPASVPLRGCVRTAV